MKEINTDIFNCCVLDENFGLVISDKKINEILTLKDLIDHMKSNNIELD